MRKRWIDGFDIEVDPDTSARMARIRQKGTTPELVVRQLLRGLGIQYRLKNRDLPGSPDIANRRRRFAIFVQGCFWHRHSGCRAATTPRRNRAFWEAKFERNIERDKKVQRNLRSMGYRVVLVWECETKSKIQALIRKLTRALVAP